VKYGFYLIISILMLCTEYEGENTALFAAWYLFVLANLANAARLVNKHTARADSRKQQ